MSTGFRSFRTSGWNLFRASLVAVIALGGCMRIYPDPDLPDVEVSWTKDDCAPGTGDVVVSLVGVDTPSYRSDVTVACNTLKTTYNDVARERYRVEGQLLDTM